MQPVIDGEQLLDDLEKLAQFGATPGGGLERVAFSPADMQARAWVENQMRAAGMTVQRDAAGNTLGFYSGWEAELPPLALGSHTDTVPQGGKFDGALGVLAGLACVRALQAAEVRLRHPVQLMNFTAEEASVGGGTLGSRAMAGQLQPAGLAQPAWDGRPVAEHLRAAGLDPEAILEARRPAPSLAAYLELHIEQGGNLEAAQLPIGIVEGIVGIRRYKVLFQGYANHAGTTPMAGRQDALVMAAPFILAVREIAMAHGIVGTIGTLRLQPGAPNVIPGQVELNLEIRGLHAEVLDAAETELSQQVRQSGGEFQRLSAKSSTISDPRLLEVLVAACNELNLPYQRMASGAGHDAISMADLGPQAMLFVPSRGGVSHSPDEFTEPEHCVAGAQVLLAALLKLDEVLDS
jgi:beta-ureidopropionase / N-carbamoyl-L-amino-acid hydrolase